MKKRLGKEFFDRPALAVARELIGKYLVRRMDGEEIAAMITETEAYFGERDLASHARHGKTLRNAPMWGEAGVLYVYFCYGAHWMLNVVTGKEGHPAAVLIRGVEGASGPGRLTKRLSIDGSLGGMRMGKRAGLWIEDRGATVPRGRIKKTPRVGVAYAGEYAKKEWRFALEAEK